MVKVAGDRDNPLSGGFTCPKGRHGADFHNDERRLRTAQRRRPDGGFDAVDVDDAIDEIAGRLRSIIAEHGVEAVGVFQGTQSAFAAITRPFLQAWTRALGTHKLFSTMTIDQSAKWIVPLRMGEYLGGRQRFDDSDVWMLSGTNPLVSLNAGYLDGALVHDPAARLRSAQNRGLKLIVIDPRRTETAARADLHIQPAPGHDALVFAGLLNVLFGEDLYDAEFCAAFVEDLDELRALVATATPDNVELRAGIPAEELRAAARIFGQAERGMLSTGTGVCMGPNSNVAEHLATCINVVCGRYLRAGEPTGMPSMLQTIGIARAEVAPPHRTWEHGFRSRIGDVGLLHDELPCGIFAEEVLEPGSDRVRALIVVGANPAAAIPDRKLTGRALDSLDLLVTVDPRISETGTRAHYIIAPTLWFERADHTAVLESLFPVPYAQYTPAVVEPGPGVIEDWQFLYRLARALGLTLDFAGRTLDMVHEPTSDELLDMLAAAGRIPLDVVQQHEHGMKAPRSGATVAPGRTEATAKLQLVPDDVSDEYAAALQRSALAAPTKDYPLVLVVRRMREVMNSYGRDITGLPNHTYNPAHINPDDMAALGLSDLQIITVRSPHGAIQAVAHGDAKVRSGVLSMTHCWGGPAEADSDPTDGGSNVNHLLTTSTDFEAINRMPTMSAVRVSVSATASEP